MVPKRWQLLPADPEQAQFLAQAAGISPILAQLLLHRGVRAAEEAQRFISAKLSELHDPAELPGVEQAAERLYSAVQAGKRIYIYGDYDVDGITASTILWRCLRLAGAHVDYYVPDRFEEGYGLNSDALHKLKQLGAETIITVDCGISAVAEAALARDLGLELIITDHHEIRAQLPPADVIVHPRLPATAYPFPHLCGAGVAFKVAWALGQQFTQARKVSEAFREFLLEAVALVALGTVADVVPLLGENRVFVRHGLRSLQAQPSVGLRALLAAAKLDQGQPLDAEHIAFHLAPRLNAAGRLGSARLAIELLATSSPLRAEDLARYLNAQNEQRQTVERRIFNAAKDQIAALGGLDELPALVLADPQWHAGVIGIVAGRLVERYARPVLLVASREEPSQGSGRSVEGFPLHEALAACSQHLLSHGGHALAAGFKLRPGAFEAFRDAFQAHARQRLQHSPRQHTLRIDAEIPLAAVTGSLLKIIDLLEPYGQGNPRPRFLASGLRLVGSPRKIGGGERHLTFQVVQEGGRPVRAVAFGMGDRFDELLAGSGACSLVFTPRLSQWNGISRIDLHVIDFQPRERPELT